VRNAGGENGGACKCHEDVESRACASAGGAQDIATDGGRMAADVPNGGRRVRTDDGQGQPTAVVPSSSA